MRLRLVSALLLCGISAWAQNPYDTTYSVTKSTSLSGAAEVVTVQHASTVNKQAKFIGLYAYCSVICTVTLERGALSTAGTNLTIVNNNPANVLAGTSTCSATSGTTISSTVVLNVFNLTAGGWVWIDASNFAFPIANADSLTLRSSSITGSVVLYAQWREQ